MPILFSSGFSTLSFFHPFRFSRSSAVISIPQSPSYTLILATFLLSHCSSPPRFVLMCYHTFISTLSPNLSNQSTSVHISPSLLFTQPFLPITCDELLSRSLSWWVINLIYLFVLSQIIFYSWITSFNYLILSSSPSFSIPISSSFSFI